jgi:hypothetical protein
MFCFGTLPQPETKTMTNESNFANDELRPIQEWENDQVHGEAIACKKVYDVHLAKVTCVTACKIDPRIGVIGVQK